MATDLTKRDENLPANPFAGQRVENINEGTVAIEQSRAVAEVQAALLIAKKFPRNKAEAFEKIIETCSRKDFAEAATYAYPRGNEKITGPSIRLAEAMANAWGNIEYGIRELAVYDGETEMEAYCWDTETNVRSKQTFRSKHERHTRQGITKLNDPRDIYESNANLGARRLRSRILAVIPSDVQAAALKQVRATLAGDATLPLSEKIKTIVSKFGRLGVKVSHLETKLGHKLEACLPDEYADLVEIYTSLKDGMASASDWFDVPKGTTTSEAAQKVDSKLGGGTPADPLLCVDCSKKGVETKVSGAQKIASNDTHGATLCKPCQEARVASELKAQSSD